MSYMFLQQRVCTKSVKHGQDDYSPTLSHVWDNKIDRPNGYIFNRPDVAGAVHQTASN